MTKLAAILSFAIALAVAGRATAGDASSPLDYKMKSLKGKEVDLSQYKGKVVLIVNVASKCGNTPQYNGLQALYEKYKDQGLVVLGFPANEFGGQEPGTDEEIAEYCTVEYGVDFPMFSKIVVKGSGIHPLYDHLTSKDKNPKFGGPIPWNFEKFVVGRDGQVAARFAHKVQPDAPQVVKTLEAELAKK